MRSRTRPMVSATIVIALLASAIGLAAAPPALAVEPAPSISVDKLLTQQVDDPTADNSILIGDSVQYTLRVSNARGLLVGRAYNVSITDVLPVGVSYLAGSASLGEPKVISNAPGAGQTTLVWSNLFDVSAAGQREFTYSVTPDPDALPVGATFTNSATGYATNDPFEVPTFSATGTCASSCTYSDTGSQVTKINAIQIRKDEPSPENELMRGIHGSNSTTYTVVVTNNKVNATNSISLTDYVPAGLEFLGCGGVDNTTGSLVEYAGATRLTAVPTIASPPCRQPVSVDTVNTDPDGSGPAPTAVYTEVKWLAFSLAPGATRTFTYRAGIPLYANTTTWAGGTAPVATLGRQTANLDNNLGASTAETTPEITYTNYALASASYQGPGVGNPSGPVAITAENTTSVTSEDLATRKSVSPSLYTIGGVATFTLTTRTSEYRGSTGASIVDTLPDGLTFISGSDTVTVNGASAPYVLSIDPAVRNAVKLTFAVTGGTLAAGATVIVTFQASMGAEYSTGAPTAAGDEYVNRVATSGTTVSAVTPNTPPGPGGTELPIAVADVSDAKITSTLPAGDKKIGQDSTSSDCSTQAYGDAIPTPPFQIGDTVCFELTLRAAPGASINNVLSPQVRDFLPTTLRYVPGSQTVGPGNTLPVSQIAFSDATSSLPGGSLLWTLGEVDPQATNPGQLVVRPLPSGAGAVFQVRFSAVVVTTVLDANKELTGNLLKTSGLDSAGDAFTGRDQVDFELAGSQVAISKGVYQINGLPTTPYPPNTDNKTVKGGDLVTFRVDVTNVGTSGAGSDAPVRDITVIDDLPAGLLCAQVSLISDLGSCAGTAPARITWTAVPDEIAAGATKTLTYKVLVPSNVSVNTNYINTATVTRYETLTNNAWVPNQPVGITDVSNVRTPNVTLTKSGTTSVTDTNNNLPDQFTVGESITYTIRGSVPGGTTASAGVIRDQLPANLLYVSSTAASNLLADVGRTIIPGQVLPSGAALARSGQVVTLTLPTPFQNATAAALTYEVTITATVLGGTYTHGEQITNTAKFSGTGFSTSKSYPATVVLPNPVIAKSNSASGPVDPGASNPVTYTLTVTNPASGSPARPTSFDTVVVDCLPAGVEVGVNPYLSPATGDPVVAGTGTGVGGNGCAAGTKRLGWTVGSVPTGTSVILTYQADVAIGLVAGTSYTNTATVTGTTLDTTDDPALEGVYSRSATSTIRTANALLSKAVSPEQAAAGETATWTITATYQRALAFYDAVVTDVVPVGVDLGTVHTVGVTCAPAPACVNVTDPTLNPTFGTEIAPSGSTIGWNVGDVGVTLGDVVVTIVYTARVKSAATQLQAGDVLVNTATNRWATTNGGTLGPVTPPTATANLVVIRPKLGIAKSVETVTPTPGALYGYTVVVTNDTGDLVSPAYLVEVLDAVPDGVIVDASTISNSGSIAGATASGGGNISWLLAGPIQPGGSVTLTYKAKLPSSATTGAFTNVVDISSYASYPTNGDVYDDVDPAEATVTVGDPSSDLSIVKTPSGSTTPGSVWTFSMAVRNLGPSDAEGPITVIDELPVGMTFVSEGPDWSCFPFGQTVFCVYFDDLPAGDSAPELLMTVQIAASPSNATYVNVATVESLTPDPTPGNNRSSATVTVSPTPVPPDPEKPVDPPVVVPPDPEKPIDPGKPIIPGKPPVTPQKPVTPLPLPDKIKPGQPTVVLPGNVITNAGQPVTATVQCRPLSRYIDKVALALDGSWVPLGQVSYCTVKRAKNGKVTVTVNYPGPVLVKVTYTAKKVPGYTGYTKVKRWVVVPR